MIAVRRKSASKHTPKAFRRATYYLRPDQIRALKLRAAAEDRQLSDVMREAVDLYLRQRP
jgi:hypothetical protein